MYDSNAPSSSWRKHGQRVTSEPHWRNMSQTNALLKGTQHSQPDSSGGLLVACLTMLITFIS